MKAALDTMTGLAALILAAAAMFAAGGLVLSTAVGFLSLVRYA